MKAVDGVSLAPAAGRTLALVGESGCGKTTVGKALLRLIEPTAGRLWLDGERHDAPPLSALQILRRAVQMVSRTPSPCLIRACGWATIEEGLAAASAPTTARAPGPRDRTARAWGLSAEMRWRYPHEFSGGQRQRIAVARALAVAPAGDRVRRAHQRARRFGAWRSCST